MDQFIQASADYRSGYFERKFPDHHREITVSLSPYLGSIPWEHRHPRQRERDHMLCRRQDRGHCDDHPDATIDSISTRIGGPSVPKRAGKNRVTICSGLVRRTRGPDSPTLGSRVPGCSTTKREKRTGWRIHNDCSDYPIFSNDFFLIRLGGEGYRGVELALRQ